MISELIGPGTKAGICMACHVEEERKTGAGVRVYKSQVTYIFDNDELELLMPQEDGKPVMLPAGVRLELVFYVRESMYRGTGIIKERYKADNRYMLRVSLKSQLHKFFRQEYSRVPCGIAVAYYDISKEQAQEAESGQYQMFADKLQEAGRKKNGIAVDISGDGVCFVSKEHLQEDSYILMQFQLQEGADARHYLLAAYVSSSAFDKNQERFVSRAEFMIKDRSVQEEIIRYIFDEERKNRMRERSPDAL